MSEKKKILIVEDDEALRMILRDAFLTEGIFEVYSSGDGVSAFDVVTKYHPDIALIDIGIPRIDGLALARMIADKNLSDKTKTLFLTNSSDISRIATASSIPGVLGYLIKADWDISAVVDQVKKKLQ